MARNRHRARLSAAAAIAARPKASEYTLWDGALSSFGLRVHRSGARSFIVQTRIRGRRRKITLGRFPDMGITEARKQAAALLARIWAGEDPVPACAVRAPLFRDFAARYRESVPDACANITPNPRRPVARYLDEEEFRRLGAVLDRRRESHPWRVAALRLLSLTGARLSEVVNLRWDEIGALAGDGASARLGDSKTGPRTIWLGPEAARLVASLPRTGDRDRLFPEDLTSSRLYNF